MRVLPSSCLRCDEIADPVVGEVASSVSLACGPVKWCVVRSVLPLSMLGVLGRLLSSSQTLPLRPSHIVCTHRPRRSEGGKLEVLPLLLVPRTSDAE